MSKEVKLKKEFEINLEEYLDISANKLYDSCILCEKERYEGACYNIGYTIECLIKYIFLKEFQCKKRDEVKALSENSEDNIPRIYKTEIRNFKISIFGEEYSETEKNIEKFQGLMEEIFWCVLNEHSFEYGLNKLKEFGIEFDLSIYRYLLDWSEQWRYRLLTKKKSRYSDLERKILKFKIRQNKSIRHNINSKDVCKSMINETALLIKQIYDVGLLSRRFYNEYYKSILEKEVEICLNTSAQ